MSLNYAAALSKYPDKGVLGLEEVFEKDDIVTQKSKELAALVRHASKIVFITGAGISTASGIPDFRGPKGVWTLEEMGLKPDVNIDFETAMPTFTHFAISEICRMRDKVCHVVSQNVDNLHMRSGTVSLISLLAPRGRSASVGNVLSSIVLSFICRCLF